ncbi:histidine phosphatase family protein [Calidithermus chliarophilus]|uniref:histidine phosphatase family protein n=1 Tax=Calidithermus chliarophilus TaxID=52023 RepID=UPI0004272BAE|nr:histidine phosphatase family protein [Calidithermus chliarophilus]
MSGRVELWLVRHGQTVWNAEGRLTGWSDVPLTGLGEAQARALAPLLAAERFDGAVASDLARAVQTARLAYGEPERVLPELRELNFGALEGLRWAELDEAHRQALLGFDGFAAPGGESTAGMRSRVYGAFDRLPAGRHLIFTHGGVLRLVLREFDQDRFLPPCAVVGLDWTARRVRFVRGEEAGGGA